VYLAHSDRRCAIEASRYGSGTLTLPAEAPHAAKLELLLAFAAEQEDAVLLPVDDRSVLFVEQHAAQLRQRFRFPRQPDGLSGSLVDKRTMYELCLREQVPTPRSAFPVSEAQLLEYADQARFPVVLKRIRPSDSSSALRVRVVRKRDELLAAYRLMEGPGEPDVMVQEYIPNVEQSNWIFNGYFDEDSRCRVAFTGRKLRQAPPYAGAATLGVCESNEAIRATTVRFLQALGYRGLVDVDYRLDCRDGQYKLLDVNPRIGASFRLFVAGDGADVLRTLYMDLVGAQLEPVAQPEGRRWIVELQDLRSSVAYLRHGDLTAREWVRSLHHVDEHAWWAMDDPRPSIALVRAVLASRLRRLWVRGRHMAG
jgi:predicted ATP-grasp superfamily ATP-dependent carboligase